MKTDFERYSEQVALRGYLRALASGILKDGREQEILHELARIHRQELELHPRFIEHIKALYSRTIEHYTGTEAALIALAELGKALEPYHNDIVLIGGLAAHLRTKGVFNHCGSNDIDLVVQPPIPLRGEKTVIQILEDLGYIPIIVGFGIPNDPPHTFSKVVGGTNVELSFICEKPEMCYSECEPAHNPDTFSVSVTVPDGNTQSFPAQEGLAALPYRLTGIAHAFNSEIPDTFFKVADVAALLVLKSIPRGGPKDCYDIFALSHCTPFTLKNGKYLEALNIAVTLIAREFKNSDSNGAYFAESFDSKQKSDDVAECVTKFMGGLVQSDKSSP